MMLHRLSDDYSKCLTYQNIVYYSKMKVYYVLIIFMTGVNIELHFHRSTGI